MTRATVIVGALLAALLAAPLSDGKALAAAAVDATSSVTRSASPMADIAMLKPTRPSQGAILV